MATPVVGNIVFGNTVPGPGAIRLVDGPPVTRFFSPDTNKDLIVLEECRAKLQQIPSKDADRVIKYLQDWNKSRPAEDT